MGPAHSAQICIFENLREDRLKQDLSIVTISTHLFSHWSIPFKEKSGKPSFYFVITIHIPRDAFTKKGEKILVFFMRLVDNGEVLKNQNISSNFEKSEISGPSHLCKEKSKHKSSCHCPLVEHKQNHVHCTEG
jgi:hypothetical protein